jgi:hypothetical protein
MPKSDQQVVYVTGNSYPQCALVLAKKKRTIHGEDGRTMPKGLNALRKSQESTDIKHGRIATFYPSNHSVLGHTHNACLDCFDCIEQCWKLLVPLLPVSIYHLPGMLLYPQCFPIPYLVLKIFLTNLHNCPHLQIGFSLRYLAQCVILQE